MPSPKAVFSSQPFFNALSAPFANGILTFDLSQSANVTGSGGLIAPRRVSITLNASGICPSTSIWFNDQLEPSTAYLMQLFDSSGNFAASFGQVDLTGASPLDLSSIVPAATGVGSASAGFVLLNPPGGALQSITGPITLSPNTLTAGTVVANSSSGGGSASGVVVSGLASAAVGIETTTGGTDQKWWDILGTSSAFSIRAVNDANSSANTGIRFNRTAGFGIASMQVFPPISGGLTSDAYIVNTRGDRQIILQNSDFEGSTLVPPPGWAIVNSIPLSSIQYETVTPAPNKLQSLKLATTARFQGIQTGTFFSVVPGESYSLTAMCKTDGTGTAFLLLSWFQANGTQIAPSLGNTYTGTSWQQITISGVAPVLAAYAVVQLENNSVTQPSTVWFDQVSVRKLDFPATLTAPGMKTANTELVFTETGDQFGTLNLHLRNRNGSNGLFIENPVQSLADIAFAATAAITNIAIDGSNNLTVTAAFGATNPSVGQTVALSGLTAATFLNGQNVTVATISPTQFTATFTHAAYASAPDTGTATVQINARGEFRNNQVATGNVTGEFQILDPTAPTVHWLTAGKSGVTINNNLITGGPSPWIDVMAPAYGAKCDGVTDDTTAINNALAAAGTVPGGSVLIPNGRTCVFTSTLTFAGKTGVALVGNRTNAGLAVTGGVPTGVPILLYTGTATPAINMSGAQQLIEGLSIIYNNAAFTGTLVSMDAGVQSANNVLHSVTLFGTSAAKNATQLLSMDNTINSKLDGVIFGNAVHALRVSNTGFSNNNLMINSEITGSITGTYVIHGGSAQAWSFINNDIELVNVTAAQNIFDFSASGCGGCNFSGNWVGDAPAAWAGSFWKQGATNGGLNISGNYINGGTSILATFMTLGNSIAGLSITGNEIGAFGTTIAFGTNDQAIFVHGNFFSNGGSFATTGTPAWAMFDVAGVATFIGNGVQLPSKTFATLPASLNGTQIYCTDCNATCTAGASTGQMCFRVNGAWTH